MNSSLRGQMAYLVKQLGAESAAPATARSSPEDRPHRTRPAPGDEAGGLESATSDLTR